MQYPKILSVGVPLLLLVAFFAILLFHISGHEDVSFIPQKQQIYRIDGEKDESLDVAATTLPQFAMSLVSQEFSNVWQANIQERKSLITAEIEGGERMDLEKNFDDKRKEMILTPKMANRLKPGLYSLEVKVKTVQGMYRTITQDFTWGVLAINTKKAIYSPGETVEIGMAVLDDFGRTKCIAGNVIVYGTAHIRLLVTSPSGKQTILSTKDGSINGSKECGDRTVTNIPDFLAHIQATEIGKYTLHMEAETALGFRALDDTFAVQKEQPVFSIERSVFPMRIYPRNPYRAAISVTVNQNYSGAVYDIVPAGFTVDDISNYGKIIEKDGYKLIQWDVSWQKGDFKVLKYSIKFPPVAPDFYLVGPLTIGSFTEGREWQIASDSIFSLVQEAHNYVSSGTSVSTSFSQGAVAGHLLVQLCSRQSNNTINTPTVGGTWTRRYRYTANQPRIYHFDKLATAGFTTGTCSVTTNSGGLAIQILEFSGNSSSGYFDKASTPTNATTCNTGAFQSTGPNITPTNPDELLVSAFASTAGSRTVTAHKAITGVSSTGFADTATNGFNGSDSSYDSGWGEAVNNPATVQNDVATFSGAGTRCTAGVVAYNPTITISQGSYRFFDAVNAVDPTTPLAAVNTPITLSMPNYRFRLRFLLDIDSPTSTLGLDAGDFILQYAALPLTNNCGDAKDWQQVTNAVAANSPPIAFSPNAGVAEASNISSTANDPSDAGSGYTTVLETYYGDDNNAGTPPDISNHQNALANNQAGLWDLSLVDNTDDSVSTTYCLRIADSSGGDLAAYRNYPRVTTIPIDVVIRGGSTIRGGTTIR